MLEALKQRVIGIIRDPEATMREHVQPAPPAGVVMRQHVLPLLIISGLGFALLSLAFPAIPGADPADVAMQAIFRLIVNVILIYMMAAVAALAAQLLGGSGGFSAAFTLLGLSMTPLFLAETVIALPGLGQLIAVAGLVFSFVVLYRTTPIALAVPQEHRGKHLALVILSLLVLLFLMISLLFGPLPMPQG